MEHEIVILAASEKNGDYCVAGIDLDSGKWFRPYSHNLETNGAVPLEHITYADGSHVKLFDVVKINFADNCQNDMQPENFYYDEGAPWIKVGKLTLDEVIKHRGTDDRVKIFFNGDRSVMKTSLVDIKKRESLLLIKVTDLEIVVEQPNIEHRNRNKKFRLNFSYNGVEYKRFAIGDTRIRRYFDDKDIGAYPFADFNFIVFSLTDKFDLNGKNYKIAAQFLGRGNQTSCIRW